GMSLGTHRELLITVLVTTVCWLAMAFFGPQTDSATMVHFYKTVRPFGPGWTKVRRMAGVSDAEEAAHAAKENIPMSLVGWVSGSVMIWSALFAVGNFLYGRTGYAVALVVVFVCSSSVLIRIVRKLWT